MAVSLSRDKHRELNSGDEKIVRSISRMSPSRLHKGLGDAIDQRRRRLIRNKPAHEFRRDEFRSRRMMRKDVQHHQSIFLTAARRNLVAEYNLFAVVMHAGPINERAGLCAQHLRQPRINHRLGRGTCTARRDDRPSRKAARNFLHVLLGVAAIDAERVQLHQFARVVLR